MKEFFNPSTDDYWVLDIETKTDFSDIRAAGLYNKARDEAFCFFGGPELSVYLTKCVPEGANIVTWNGTRFDDRLLKSIWGISLEKYNMVDGMLAAKMAFPDEHSFSLDSIAKLLDVPIEKGLQDLSKEEKIAFYDHAPPGELWDYLLQDLHVTAHVIEKLYSKSYHISRVPRAFDRALKLETKVAELCQDQVDTRVRFDTGLALGVWTSIVDRMREIEDILEPVLPNVPMKKSKLHYPPKVQFKKDGTPSELLQKYCAKYGFSVSLSWGKWQAVRTTSPVLVIWDLPLKEPLVTSYKLELRNQEALKDWLLELGWKPTEWNQKKEDGKWVKTSPRLTSKDTKEPCPNLTKCGFRHAGLVAEWLMLRSRKNVVCSDKRTGWLPTAEAYAALTGEASLPSDADTLGANTARWTHKGIANIPRVSSPYGKEFRQLFCARKDKWWVGWDASSLEACMEGHWVFPYDKDYVAELMDGDIHTKNLHLIPALRDRDHSKTFKYGITYGAQPAKVSSILGCSKSEGQLYYDMFWDGNKGLKQLKEELAIQAAVNRGFIKTIDGRLIKTRSQHSQLNALFQSSGAIVMKYAMGFADKMIKAKFGAAQKGLIRYHDEEIWECTSKEIAEEVGKLGVQSIIAAGRYLELNVPLNGEYKVGKNWADVH